MKAQFLFIVALLVSSIFATSAILAKENGSVGIKNLASLSSNSSEIEDALNDTESHINYGQYKKVGFATVIRGSGWATDDDTGFLLSGFWLNQKYYKDNEGNSQTASFGELKIVGVGNYKLVRKTNSTDENESKVVFYLVPNGVKARDLNESKNNSVGTLTLTKDKEYSDFVKWSGTLKLTSGDNEGSYDVDFAVVKDTIKPVNGDVLNDTKEVKKAVKQNFFEKFKFWKHNNGNNQDKGNRGNSPNNSEDQ